MSRNPVGNHSPRGSFRVTPRGWCFLAAAGAVGAAAWHQDNPRLAVLFAVIFGLFAASALLTVLVARNVTVDRRRPDDVAAGDPFEVRLRLRNGKGFWPAFALRLEDRLREEGLPDAPAAAPVWIPWAAPRRKVAGRCVLRPRRRGWADLGPVVLTSEFPPGLCSWRAELPGDDRILVTPRVGRLRRNPLDLRTARLASADVVSAATATGEEEFAGLRDYRPGDHPRRIHWRASARGDGRLRIREFDDARARRVRILLETFIPRPGDTARRGRLELAVTFAAALADALLAGRRRVDFQAFAPHPAALELEPRRGALAPLLRLLAGLRPSRTRRVEDLLAEIPGGAASAADLVVLRLDDGPPPAAAARDALWLGPREMKELLVFPRTDRDRSRAR